MKTWRALRIALDDVYGFALVTLIVVAGAFIGLVAGLAKYGPPALWRVVKKRW